MGFFAEKIHRILFLEIVLVEKLTDPMFSKSISQSSKFLKAISKPEKYTIFYPLSTAIFLIHFILTTILIQLQAALILICMEMDTAMTKTTIKPVSLMAGTAVDPMLIQMTALNVTVTAMLLLV